MKAYNYDNARFPEKITIAESRNQGLGLEVLDRQGGTFRIDLDAVQEQVLRIRLYRETFAAPFGSSVCEKEVDGKVTAGITRQDGRVILDTGKMRVEVGEAPFTFCVYGKEAEPVYEEQMADVDSVLEGFHRMMPMGYEETGKIWNICARLRPDEHIWGLGERFTEFDKRGQAIRMWKHGHQGCYGCSGTGRAYRSCHGVGESGGSDQ
ncbi:MAG: alpha-glucosidase domain-containing protein [Candidatus Limivivens sp.]|nr:alpha-glucosidase domain-containing protein [Candidatus Limivivens sp.]